MSNYTKSVPGQSRYAVIADDVDTIANLGGRYLQAFKLFEKGQTEACENGKEALDFCLKNPLTVQLLITDWNMPVMGGEGLIMGLKKEGHPIYEKKKIIVMTGQRDDTAYREVIQKLAGLEIPDNNMFQKPPNWPDVMKMAGELVSSI
ncbi:MAG: response regulator [Candidatus Aenigmarchaeota archaeon]|nr:response regulator [Candidatus Aenigmarchaeota archaeon]